MCDSDPSSKVGTCSRTPGARTGVSAPVESMTVSIEAGRVIGAALELLNAAAELHDAELCSWPEWRHKYERLVKAARRYAVLIK